MYISNTVYVLDIIKIIKHYLTLLLQIRFLQKNKKIVIKIELQII